MLTDPQTFLAESSPSSSDPPGCLCADTAFRFLIRDMGNEVSRIEAVDRVRIEDARIEKTLPGRHEVPIPFPENIKELCQVAHDLGLCRRCSGCVPTAFCRAIDEHTMEVIIWRSP